MKKIMLITFLVLGFNACDKEVFTGLVENEITNFGKIFVSSIPKGYKLYVDNKYMNVTSPDSIPYITEGIHKLALKHDFFSDSTLNIDVKKSSPLSLSIDMMKNPRFYAKVICSTNPQGAKIFLNDVSTNQVTPAALTNIYPGELELKFIKNQFRDDSVIVKFKGGEYSEMYRDLEDTSRTVSYRTSNSRVTSNVLNKVVVDKYNNKWIGSIDHGLMKFDGKNWTSFENSGVIGSERIKDLLIDKKGRLWVGSVKGLYVFDGFMWQSFSSNLPSSNVTALEEDINGNIWIATLNELIKYDNVSFKVFTSSNTGVPLTNLSSLASSKNGDLWVGSFTWGIIQYTGNNWIQYDNYLMELDNSISNEISDLIVDMNGNLYAFGTADNGQRLRSALIKYNGLKWVEIKLSLLFQPNIYSFYNDDENNLWFAVTGGLVKYNESKPISFYDSDKYGFFSRLSSSFCIDQNGDGWLTTLGGGIVKLKKGFF